MAKQPKPKSNTVRNDSRRSGKAPKKNPRTPVAAEDRKSDYGYSVGKIAERAAKRNQTYDEHLAYLSEHARTKAARRKRARIERKKAA